MPKQKKSINNLELNFRKNILTCKMRHTIKQFQVIINYVLISKACVNIFKNIIYYLKNHKFVAIIILGIMISGMNYR